MAERTSALTADVSEAHRQISTHARDWHLLGCQVHPGGPIFINKVATFGVGSASYRWSVASTRGRPCHQVASTSPTTITIKQAWSNTIRPSTCCSSLVQRQEFSPHGLEHHGGDLVSWLGFPQQPLGRHLAEESIVVCNVDQGGGQCPYSQHVNV